MEKRLRVQIRSEMDVARAALETTQFARAAGFADTPSRMVATAVSELARNILKYAGVGDIRLCTVHGRRGNGVEVVATDNGPGIPDVEAAMSDHFSTGRTLGLGLPGVRRLMDDFSIDSAVGSGTRITATKWI